MPDYEVRKSDEMYGNYEVVRREGNVETVYARTTSRAEANRIKAELEKKA